MYPTSYCSILVLQGPTCNPRGFFCASATFDFFFLAPVRLPGSLFVAPARLLHFVPAFSFEALCLEHG